MTYLSGKKKQNKKHAIYAVYVFILFGVIFFWPSVRKTTYKILEPIVIRYSITKNAFTFFPEFFSTYITSHKTLVIKNKELDQKIEDLENELAKKDAKLREVMSLNSNNFNDLQNTASTIIMYPLMQDHTHIYSTVLLSKGFKDGIIVGDIAFVRGYQAVCEIKEVYTSSSLCLLFTSSGEETEGVTSSSSISLSLLGRGGYYIADVTRDTPVLVGENVYLKSNPAMILGTIRQVTQNNQDTSWHIFIEGAYNPIKSSVFYVHH